MTLLVAAVGSPQVMVIAGQVARRALRYAHETARELYGNSWVALYSVGSGPQSDVAHGRQGPRLWWVIGDESGDGATDDGGSKCARGRHPTARATTLTVDEQAQTVGLTTDRLGVGWLYMADLPEGIVLSSDFGALAQELKGRLTIDYDTVLLELSIGYTPGDHTIFNQIHTVPPGAVLEFRDGRIVRTSIEPVEYGDRHAGDSRAAKFRVLDEIYAGIGAELQRGCGAELSISMSAGFDSRYGLAVLDAQGMKPPLSTFGDPASGEVIGAKAVCAGIDRTTTIFPIPPGDWQQWRRCTEILGNAGMIQWAGWAESWLKHVRERGRFVLVGYLGDALSGKHLGGCTERTDWIGFWIRWSSEGGWMECPVLRLAAAERLGRTIEGRFRTATEGTRCAFPHQAALHLDLYGRQRRWVASQPVLISRFVRPVLFFYDERLVDFWTNLAIDDLAGQRLYLDYAMERFPRLFPRNQGFPPSLAIRAARKAARLLTGRDGHRPPAIDHRRLIEPNRPQIVRLLQDVGHVLEPIMDVRALGELLRRQSERHVMSTAMVIRVVNVLLLLALAYGSDEPGS